MLVIKFGGSSVHDSARIRAAAHIAAGHRAHEPAAVVVSAMAGVTDGLLRCAEAALARDGEWGARLTEIEQRHRAAYTALSGTVPAAFDTLWQALLADLTALSYAGPPPGSRAALDEASRFSGWGERLIVGIFAATLSAHGTPAEALYDAPVLLAGREAGEGGGSGDSGGNEPARPSVLATRAWLGPRLSSPFLRGAVPVLPGYIARDAAGRNATLGRNGSDHSAAVIAAALGAQAIYLYSDVAGVYSADPHVVPEARLLPALTYAEAAEVAALGARVLHPRTVEPLARWRIPLYLRDMRRPDGPGTDVLPPGGDVQQRSRSPLSWVISARPLPHGASYLPVEQWRSDLAEVSATLIGPVRWRTVSDTPLAAAMAAVLARGEPVAALSVSGRRLRVAVPAAASVPTQRQLHTTLAALRPSEEHAADAFEPQPQATAVG